MTDYNKISYDTETYTDAGHGYGILANEQLILANSQDYLATGAVVMRDVVANAPVIKCNDTVILCKDRWTINCNGTTVYVKQEYV